MAVKDVPDYLVVRACAERQSGQFATDLLMEWTGQPLKVCIRAMERSEDRGLIEYGVSLRTAWLTDKGRQVYDDTKGTK